MGSLTPKPRLFCRLRFAQHLQAYVGLLPSAASATALRASLSPVRFLWGFRKPSCTGRSAPRPPRGLGFAAAAPAGTGVWCCGLCRVSLRFLPPPLCSPALGPEAGVVADKFPGNVMEWGRQKAVTHTESTEQMSLVGHLCRSRWATLFSPPSRRRPLLQTAGPVPWRFRPLPVRSL